MPQRIFISYSSRDRRDALLLKELAEADGHDVWLDLFDIRPAERLRHELERGVRTADVLCVLLSPTAVDSPWVLAELQHAVQAEASGLRVLPVILRPAELPAELADRVGIDATRGLADPGVAARIRRALGGQVADGVLLDDLRRSELADQAEVDTAEAAFPALRQRLARAMDAPIRKLKLEIDQDSWPADTGRVLEIVLQIDTLGFYGSAHILLAPYVEGHTWPTQMGLDELPPDNFFALRQPRVDARFLWAGRTLTPVQTLDGTDLREMPLQCTFELPGDEYTGEERVRTMTLLTRFELPSLRGLIDRGSTVTVWSHPAGGGEPEQLDPARSDLRMHLKVPLRHDEHGIYGFRLWSHHDRVTQVLLTAPSLVGCATDIEREALLSLYRAAPLRAQLNSPERQAAIQTALANGEPLPPEDLWAGFHLLAGSADVPRLRGQLRTAVEHVRDAIQLVADVDPATVDYPKAFALLTAFRHLVNDLARAGGTAEAITFYSDTAVDLARTLTTTHPAEPDYVRALADVLVQRAQLRPGTDRAKTDVREAVAAIDKLAKQDRLPWRVDEARRRRADTKALLKKHNSKGA